MKCNSFICIGSYINFRYIIINILQFSVVQRNNGELQSIKCSDVIINYNRVVFCFPLETHEA